MGQRRQEQKDEDREVRGWALGDRRGRGAEAGWFVSRDGEAGPLVTLPPRGTVRGNWDADDDAAGW